MLQGGRQLIRLFHPGAAGPAPDQDNMSPGATLAPRLPLIAAMAAFSIVKTLGRARVRNTPSASITVGSIAVALMTEPSGHRLPDRKHDGARQSLVPGDLGRHDHVIGIDTIALPEQFAELPCRRGLSRHCIEDLVPRLADDGQALTVDDAQLAQVQHDFGHTTGQVHLHRRVIDRTVGQHVDKPRELRRLTRRQSSTVGRSQTGGVGDRGNVQQKIGRATAGRMHGDGVANGRLGQDVAESVVGGVASSIRASAE